MNTPIINYQVIHKEDPTHLLTIINGFGRPGRDFLPFINLIQKDLPHYAFLILDNRGSGTTEYTGSFTIDDLAQDALTVTYKALESLKISHFSLLGTSMGGLIVQAAASAYTKDPKFSLDKIILVNSILGGPAANSPTQKDFEFHSYFSKHFLKEYPEKVDLMVRTLSLNTLTQANLDQRKALTSSHASEYWPNIKCPTLFIVGEDDRVTPPSLSEAISQNIDCPKTWISYPDVGHLILVEALKQFVKDVGNFL